MRNIDEFEFLDLWQEFHNHSFNRVQFYTFKEI